MSMNTTYLKLVQHLPMSNELNMARVLVSYPAFVAMIADEAAYKSFLAALLKALGRLWHVESLQLNYIQQSLQTLPGKTHDTDGLVPSCGISIANALEITQSKALSYYSDLTLSQAFQPMAAQLSKKAVLPLAKILATASYRSSKTGPSTKTSKWSQIWKSS